jgi:homoserine acetyltransferase
MKGKVLILKSESDKAFDLDQKKAVNELFPDAYVHTFKDTGHLTLLTALEEFMKIMKAFLKE